MLTRRCTRSLIAAGLVTAVVAAGLLTSPAVDAAVPMKHAATRTLLVSPTQPDGKLKPSYRISNTASSGDCSSGSDYLPGADRCFVGNLIYDPCWNVTVSKNKSGAYCPSQPWSHDGLFIRTYSTAYPDRRGQGMWAVQTADGHRCVLLDGAVDSYRNKPVDFACGSSGRYLLGQPSRQHARWTIEEVRADKHFNYSHEHRVSIKRAWLGASAVGAITKACPADHKFVKIWDRRYPHGAARADLIRCSHGWAAGGLIPPGRYANEFTATFKRTNSGWRALPRDTACRPNGIPKKPHYFWMIACDSN